jgi:hypothetical protein
MHFPVLRVPARIAEHPVESAIAGLLLLALLFVSADPGAPRTAGVQPAAAADQNRL